MLFFIFFLVSHSIFAQVVFKLDSITLTARQLCPRSYVLIKKDTFEIVNPNCTKMDFYCSVENITDSLININAGSYNDNSFKITYRELDSTKTIKLFNPFYDERCFTILKPKEKRKFILCNIYGYFGIENKADLEKLINSIVIFYDPSKCYEKRFREFKQILKIDNIPMKLVHLWCPSLEKGERYFKNQ